MDSSSCPDFTTCSTDASTCWDGNADTAKCWRVVWSLLSVGIILIVMGDWCIVRVGLLERALTFLRSNNNNNKSQQQSSDGSLLVGNHRHNNSHRVFFATQRTIENFCRNIDDPDTILPNSGHPSYEPKDFGPAKFAFTTLSIISGLKLILYSRYIHSICLNSLGWGCICSAISTIFWLMMSWENYCYDANFTTSDSMPNTNYIIQVGTALSTVLGNYLFFPIFLMTGHVGFAVAKWRSWHHSSFEIRDSLKNVATSTAAVFELPPVSLEIRKQSYKVYRLINCIHAICYAREYGIESPDDYVTQGLLTQEERDMLNGNPNHIQEVVMTWLQAAVTHMMWYPVDHKKAGLVNDLYGACFGKTSGLLDTLRDRVNHHFNLRVEDNPNLYLRMMFLTQDLFLVLIMVTYTFSLTIYIDNNAEGGGPSSSLKLLGTPCFQPVVLLGVFLYTAAIRSVFMLIFILRDPFQWEGEILNVDGILAGTDASVFAILRALFYSSNNNSEEESAATKTKNLTTEVIENA